MNRVQQMKALIKRCQKSSSFFIQNFCKVEHPKAGIIPFNLFKYQKKALKAYQEKRYNIYRKCRQCFVAGSIVWTPSGPKPIETIKKDDLVYSLVDGTLTVVKVDKLHNNGKSVRELYEVRTKSGHRSICTHDHEFLTNRGWVKAEDLTQNDVIVEVCEPPRYGKSVSDSDAILLGYLITDGSYGRWVNFTNSRWKYLLEFQRHFELKFGKRLRIHSHTSTFNPDGKCYRLQTNDKAVRQWLSDLGIDGQTGNQKRIPEDVFTWNNRSIAILINRMFAGDGWYSGGNCNEIGIGQESEIILHQLKQLLSRFGINSKFYPRKNDTLAKLRIMGGKDFDLFVKNIGIFGKKPRNEITKGFFFNRIKGQVKSVKPQQIQRDLYDLTVPPANNYIVDGAVVHNCGISTLTGAFALWYAMFYPRKRILIVSKRDKDAKDFLKKNVKFVYQHLPTEFLDIYGNPEPETWNEHSVGFSNGSMISSLTSSRDTLRSNSASLNIIDESAFMPHMDDMWAGGQQCCTLSSILSTINGLYTIGDILNNKAEPKESAQHDLELITDKGIKHSNAVYNNGYAKTIRITTEFGYSFEATPNHRLRVIDREGQYAWRYMKDMKKNDQLCLMRNTCVGEPVVFKEKEVALVLIEKKNAESVNVQCNKCYKEFTRKTISIKKSGLKNGDYYTCPSCSLFDDRFVEPDILDETMAELIGYYIGDGTLYKTRPKRIKLCCDPKYPDIAQELINRFAKFGIFAYKEKGHGTIDVRANNAKFVNWMIRHDLNSKSCAEDARIPTKILASGPKIIAAFLRGLFEADGYCAKSTFQKIGFSTRSATLADQVRTVLLSIGIVTKTHTRPGNGFSNGIKHEVYVLDQANQIIFRDKVGFLSNEKSVIINSYNGDHSKLRITGEAARHIANTLYESDHLDSYSRARCWWYRHHSSLPLHRLREFNINNELINNKDLFVDKIVNIEHDHTLTADVSVPDNNTYIANGFVSHNTLMHGGSCIVISTCVAGNSLVITDNGLQRIGDMYDKFDKFDDDYDVTEVNERIATDIGVSQSARLFRHKRSPIIRVRTKEGTELVADKKHCLYIFNQSLGWKNVDQLNFDDYIAIKSGSDLWGDNNEINFEDVNFSCDKIDEKLSYKLGLLLAEGYINKDYVVFANGDMCLHHMFRNEDGWDPESGRGTTHSRKCSRGFVRFLEFVGFKRIKNSGKVFPHRILQCSKKIVAAFIRGMYDGDGFSRTRDGSVGYVSTSKHIINDLKTTLLNFGIQSRIEDKPAYIREFRINNKHYTSKCQKSYVLIAKGSDARKFYKDIGFGLDRKQCNLDKLKEDSYDLTPPIVPIIRQWMRNNNISIEKLKNQAKVSANKLLFKGTGRIRISILRRILNAFPNAENGREQLDYISSPGMRFEKVKTLEDAGIGYTYDFDVPDRKRLLTNGMVSHNTNGVGNWYHGTWLDAEKSKNEFNPILINWWDMDWTIEFRDELTGQMQRISPTAGMIECKTKEEKEKWGPYWSPWLEEQYRALQRRGETHLFRQEVLAEFVGTGNTVLDYIALKHVSTTVLDKYWVIDKVPYTHPITGQEMQLDFDNKLKIWRRPVRPEPDIIEHGRIIKPGASGHPYSVGVDISSGEGDDFSSIEVIDCITLEQVAELNIKVLPNILALMAEYICRWYNNAFMVPERTGIGIPVCNEIYHELGYSNVFRMKTPAGRISKKIGFPTTTAYKPQLNKALLDFIQEEGGTTIYSRDLEDQLNVYVYLGNNRTGCVPGVGNYDDLTMAFGLACLGVDQAMVSDQSSLVPTRNIPTDNMDASPLSVNDASMINKMLEQGGIGALIPVILTPYASDILTPNEMLQRFTNQLGGTIIGSKYGNPNLQSPHVTARKHDLTRRNGK